MARQGVLKPGMAPFNVGISWLGGLPNEVFFAMAIRQLTSS